MANQRTGVFVPVAFVLSGLMTVFLHSFNASAASDHPGDPPGVKGFVCESEPSPYFKQVWEKLESTAQPIMTGQGVPFRLNPEVGYDVGHGALRFELKERSRMTIRLQPADKQPSYVLANAGVRILDSEGRSYDPEKLIRENESLFLELYLLLPPGSYLVEIIGRWNWGASTIPQSEKGRSYAAEVLELIGAPLRTELLPLQTWFEGIKVAGCFEVLYLSEYSDLTESDTHMLYELFAIGAERRKAKTNLPPLSEKPAAGYSVTWLKDHDIPRYLLRLRANMGAAGQEDFEKKFADQQGVSFWQRVIEKVSLTTGISAHEIAAVAPVPCFGDIVAEVSGNFYRFLRWGCLAPSAGVDLPVDFHPRVMLAQDRQVASIQDDFPTAIGRYLETTFGGTASISYLTREDSYVQAIIRGLKGRVIHGGRYWERLNVSFALLQPRASARVRVLIDGVLAAGVGDYPPDSQFTRNMEPEYAASLTEFTAQMADGLREFLSRSDQR